MLRRASLVMVFSDLLGDTDPVMQALYRLRHSGHDVILFHILDEAETRFPFNGRIELEDPETLERVKGTAESIKRDYLRALDEFRGRFRTECTKSRIDYVPLDTAMRFDKALIEYLARRSGKR